MITPWKCAILCHWIVSYSNACSPAKPLPLPTDKLIASGYFLRHKIVNASGIDGTVVNSFKM